MAALSVVFDNQLEFSDIVTTIEAPKEDEVEGSGVRSEESQTMLQGVVAPLVSICGITYDFQQIHTLELRCDDRLPSITLVVLDDERYLSNISKPGRDNEIRVQILPPFDEAYKKINLTFFIDSISIQGNKVRVSGKYKVPDLYSSRLASFGEVNTYDLFKQIAQECKLGFVSNCESNDIDKRFVYANNTSYLDLMNKQIMTSGDQTNVYDYWIDLWNNINLANVHERYYAVDKDEDMLVWVQKGFTNNISRGDRIETVQQALILNNSAQEMSPLHLIDYKVITDSGKATRGGTDQVYTYYKNGEVVDTLVQDGNVKRDVFVKYVYLGENIGDFDYLAARSIRSSFLDIIHCNKLNVVMDFPNLAVMRGHQCKVVWYDNNMNTKNDMKNVGSDGETNINIDPQDEEMNDPNAYVINKQISGQYLIDAVVIKYELGNWKQTLTLIRPQDDQNKVYDLEGNGNR